MSPSSTIHFLLVEDDDVDVMAMERAFRRRGFRHSLTVVRDGRAALAALRGEDGRRPLPRPYIIILDLNLPVMNGLEVLRELRRDPAHRSAIVFVLTTSNADQDRRGAYDHNVAGYVLKSEVGQEPQGMADLLERYCHLVQLP
jgi:CheY-like chemotaxis protein